MSCWYCISDQRAGKRRRFEVLPEGGEVLGRAELRGQTVRSGQGGPGWKCVRLGGQGRVRVSKPSCGEISCILGVVL